MTATVSEETLPRCSWCEGNELALRYHDEEWGTPIHDDRTHFEFLVLESAQAGLSWMTILRKREAYRKAYRGFDPRVVARFGARDVQRLLNDAGIVRNRRKIESSINNAARFLEVQEQFGSFDSYLWGFVGGSPLTGGWKSLPEIPAKTELSDRISRDLKARGFGFVGSTIVYSHLQAVGLVNDHLVHCFRYRELQDRGRQAPPEINGPDPGSGD